MAVPAQLRFRPRCSAAVPCLLIEKKKLTTVPRLLIYKTPFVSSELHNGGPVVRALEQERLEERKPSTWSAGRSYGFIYRDSCSSAPAETGYIERGERGNNISTLRA